MMLESSCSFNFIRNKINQLLIFIVFQSITLYVHLDISNVLFKTWVAYSAYNRGKWGNAGLGVILDNVVAIRGMVVILHCPVAIANFKLYLSHNTLQVAVSILQFENNKNKVNQNFDFLSEKND